MGIFRPLLLTSALLSAISFSDVANADIAGLAMDEAQFPLGTATDHGIPLGNGLAKSDDPWWMETIKHQGTSPTNPDPESYRPFRNVKVCCTDSTLYPLAEGTLRTLGPSAMVFTMIQLLSSAWLFRTTGTMLLIILSVMPLRHRVAVVWGATLQRA